MKSIFLFYGALHLGRFTIKEQLKNEEIVLKELRVVGPDGEQLGIMSSEEANKKAKEFDLDLVLIAPTANPPVAKIIDYSKYRFDTLKKLKEQKKNQKQSQLKEVQLSMTIDKHDLETKAKQTIKFLSNGDKVKVGIRMSGRMITKAQMGVDVMNQFASMVESVGSVDKAPEVNGRNIFMNLVPKK